MSIISQYINDISTTFALNKLTKTPDAMSNLWMLYIEDKEFNNNNLDKIMRINNINGIPSTISPFYKFNYISSNITVPLTQTGYQNQELRISVVIDQNYKLAEYLYESAYNTHTRFNAILYFLKPQTSSSVTNTIDTLISKKEITDTTKASTQMQEDHSEELKTSTDSNDEYYEIEIENDETQNQTQNQNTEQKTLLQQLKLLTKQFENSQIAQGILATFKDGINSGWLLSNKTKHITKDMNLIKNAFTESILENDKILELVDPRTFFGLEIAKVFEFQYCYITSFDMTNSLNYQGSSPITGTFTLHFENIVNNI